MASYIKILKFDRKYFVAALFLLFIEILIAVYAHDRIIRPYVGDFLVVIFLYCLLRSFLGLPVVQIAIFVLIFSYAIEFLQYLQLIKWAGLENYGFAKVIMGSSFEWIDILAYTIGIILVVVIEKYFLEKKYH